MQQLDIWKIASNHGLFRLFPGLSKAEELRKLAILQGVWDFFPTPPALIQPMIQLAEIKPGMRVLEPSAGAGDICSRLRSLGIEPDCFEINPLLRECLQLQGFRLIGGDFLADPAQPIYDRVLLNPPFSKGLDVEHIRHAWKWLRPGGRLVSIANNALPHFKSSKREAFRQWLRRVGATVIDNPPNSFVQSDRPTSVSTQTLVIDR